MKNLTFQPQDLLVLSNPVLSVLEPYLEWEVPPMPEEYGLLLWTVQQAILSCHDNPDAELEEFAQLKAMDIVDALYFQDFDLAKSIAVELFA